MRLLSSLKNTFLNRLMSFKVVTYFLVTLLFLASVFNSGQAHAKYDRIRYDENVQILTGTKDKGFLALPEGYAPENTWDYNEENDSVKAVIAVITSMISAASMSGVALPFVTAQVYNTYGIAIAPIPGVAIVQAPIVANATFLTRYDKAEDKYKALKLCGDDWYSYKETDDVLEFGEFDNSYAEKVIEELSTSSASLLDSKPYREYVYQGREYEDSSCLDPEGSPQKYYFKGKHEANFACERFVYNGVGEYSKYKQALTCCKEREKKYTCLTDGVNYKFCKVGEGCEFSDLDFEIYRSQKQAAKICARVKPRSVYPFGFNIAGGSEECIEFSTEEKESGNNRNECKNSYQLDRHCVVSSVKYYRELNFPSLYLDKSCGDFISNTLYTPNYQSKEDLINNNMIDLQSNSLSAPIVQCLKESLQNMLQNKVGYSLCTKVDDKGNDVFVYSDESVCPEGFILRYSKGSKADSSLVDSQYRKTSIISQIQNLMRNIVILILYLSVTLYGYNILKAGGKIDKNNLMIYVFKIAVVAYIVFSSAWIDTFIVQIYNASSTIARIVPSISESDKEYKRDGCQFNSKYNINHFKYGDKVYLEVFDTLDCKLNKYLGGSASKASFSIIKMMVANLVPYIGPINYYIFLGVFFIMINLILLVSKTIYAFIASFIGILIGAFILPILIPSILFKRTKKMINVWGNYMMGYVLYPPLLFAYLMMVFQIYDYVLADSSVYLGNAPVKELYCGEYYENYNGDISLIDYGVGIKGDSTGNLICLFDGGDSESAFNFPVPVIGKLLDLLGISFMLQAMSFIVTAGILKTIIMLTQAIAATYIFEKMLDIIPSLIQQITGGVPGEDKLSGGALGRIGSLKRVGDAFNKGAARLNKNLLRNKSKSGNGSSSRGGSPVKAKKPAATDRGGVNADSIQQDAGDNNS